MDKMVDHEDRENEGDLIIPAQMATPDAINFMASHGKGLICLAMAGNRIEALDLPLMAPPATSSRSKPAMAGFWSAQAIQKPPSTSPVWPASTLPV